METTGESRQLTWREVVGKSAAFLASKGVNVSLDADNDAYALALSVGAAANYKDSGIVAAHGNFGVNRGHNDTVAVIGEDKDGKKAANKDKITNASSVTAKATDKTSKTAIAGLVLEWLRGSGRPGAPLVVDVGTGTGAIVLSLAKEYVGEATFLGTDVSEDAVALARENAERCLLADRVGFAVMDGLDDFDEPQCVDAIVSNPPYIESAVVDTLDPRVRDFEPRLALDGGATGLDFYDRYIADALNLLKVGGAVFFEIGDTQGEAVRRMMESYGFGDIRISKDLSGRDRYASATLT